MLNISNDNLFQKTIELLQCTYNAVDSVQRKEAEAQLSDLAIDLIPHLEIILSALQFEEQISSKKLFKHRSTKAFSYYLC